MTQKALGILLTVLTVISIILTLVLSTHSTFCGVGVGNILQPICAKFDLENLTPVTTLIWAQNQFTIILGLLFYVILEDESWIVRLISIGTLFFAFLVTSLFFHSAQMSLVLAAILSSVFFLFDWRLACRSAGAERSPKDWTHAEHLVRGCLYSSLPCTLALWLVVVYDNLHKVDVTQEQISALVAGSAAFALFASNAAFSLLHLVPIPTLTAPPNIVSKPIVRYVAYLPFSVCTLLWLMHR